MRKILLAGAFALAWAPALFAADLSVPNMTAGSAPVDADLYYSVQSSADRKVTAAQLKTYANLSAVDARTTTTEAINNTDQNKLVTFNNAGAVACSIAQAGGGGSFVAGWAVSLKNYGAGTVTCTAATSVFIDVSGAGTSTITLLTGQGVELYSDGTNYIVWSGSRGQVANGTAALGTGAVTNGTCSTAVTVSAPNVATTDVITVGFNGDPTATTGYLPTAMLTIVPYPTAGNVNFKQCNLTGSSITPSALTVNWSVKR